MVSAEPEVTYVGDTSWSPVVGCTIGSIVSSFLSLGIIAAYLPKSPPAVWPLGLLGASAALLLTAIALLAARPGFAWRLFFQVARWVVVLTAVFAAMAVYVFVSDGTPRSTLAILATVLGLAALNVPLLIGFSVARHERPGN